MVGARLLGRGAPAPVNRGKAGYKNPGIEKIKAEKRRADTPPLTISMKVNQGGLPRVVTAMNRHQFHQIYSSGKLRHSPRTTPTGEKYPSRQAAVNAQTAELAGVLVTRQWNLPYIGQVNQSTTGLQERERAITRGKVARYTGLAVGGVILLTAGKNAITADTESPQPQNQQPGVSDLQDPGSFNNPQKSSYEQPDVLSVPEYTTAVYANVFTEAELVGRALASLQA